ALFLAGRGLLSRPEGKWSARLDSAGELRDLDNAQSGLKLEGPLLASPLTVQNQSSDTLYQQLTLSGYPRQAPAANNVGMSIRREYLGMNGQPLDIRALKSGDLVLVHLALTATTRVPDALVVDLLPAGLELENQNLAQSAASLENASSAVKQWRESMQNANLVHQEFRDDRYVAALPVNSYGTTHLLYLARAVTPGTYRVPPPQVESMYRPNMQSVGESAGEMVVRGR
ncbi:MAG: alpha-2-macroglobulin family protein, partial [Pseudomonas sp.]